MLGVVDNSIADVVANASSGVPVNSRISTITLSTGTATAAAATSVTTSRKVLTTIVFCGIRKSRWHFHLCWLLLLLLLDGDGGGVGLPLSLCVCVCVCIIDDGALQHCQLLRTILLEVPADYRCRRWSWSSKQKKKKKKPKFFTRLYIMILCFFEIFLL